jgi:hypothetical protein
MSFVYTRLTFHCCNAMASHCPQISNNYLILFKCPPGPAPGLTQHHGEMDFRGDISGDFVYHCHILGHEDSGMMAIVRVLPRN